MYRTHSQYAVSPEQRASNTHGLVGHWLGGGGSGSTWYDVSGGQHHAVFAGAPGWTLNSLRTRYGVKFAASTDLANATAATSFANLAPSTVAAWVYTTDTTNEQTIVAKLNAGATLGWTFVIEAGGALTYFRFGDAFSLTATTNIPLNQPTHVAFTQNFVDASDGLLYVNGTPVAFTPGTKTGVFTSDAAANLTLGGAEVGGTPFVGVLDDVRLYNRALSAAEISMLASPSWLASHPNGSRTFALLAAVGGLFMMAPLDGLGVSGPFFRDPLGA